MAYFSSDYFPASRSVKEASGLPWGCVLQPFKKLNSDYATVIPASRIARCEHCYAYINPFVRFGSTSWSCSLCRQLNAIPSHYRAVNDRSDRPELTRKLIEYELDDIERGGQNDFEKGESFPGYVFCMDVSGSAEYVDLVKSSVLAALEALSPEARVALCVFSDRAGLYDLRCEIPHVRYTRIHPDGYCSVPFDDILPLHGFLVPLGEYKDNICAAVESICSIETRRFGNKSETSKSSLSGVNGRYKDTTVGGGDGGEAGAVNPNLPQPDTDHDTAASRKRGFGTMLEYLVQYLSYEQAHSNSRILTFLSGIPNYGSGILKNRLKESEEGEEQWEMLKPQSNFYQQQGIVAAKKGVCCDLYIVTNQTYVDIASLKYLTLLTGGNLMLYDRCQDALLPQDLFRQLKKSQGFRGLLRLRTSREFQPSSVYGHIIADDEYENLFHIAGIDSQKCLAFDFEFTSGDGFTSYNEAKPVIQMAFAYTVLEHVYDEEQDCEVERPLRRLRVHTIKLDIASSVGDIYKSANSDVIMSLLTQQAIHLSIDSGIAETRLLIQDFLINLLYRHADEVSRKARANPLEYIDVGFNQYEELSFVPRFLFGLLKSHILTSDSEHPDYRVYLQCLYSALQPNFLSKALYPSLTAYSDLDTSTPNKMILSMNELSRFSFPVYVLDSYTGLYVLYTHQATDVPFPPPLSSGLRKSLKRIKDRNPLISPRVVFAKVGTLEANAFMREMIEDSDVSGFSFDQFINSMYNETVDLIKSEAKY